MFFSKKTVVLLLYFQIFFCVHFTIEVNANVFVMLTAIKTKQRSNVKNRTPPIKIN